jgi:hypothetical protein
MIPGGEGEPEAAGKELVPRRDGEPEGIAGPVAPTPILQHRLLIGTGPHTHRRAIEKPVNGVPRLPVIDRKLIGNSTKEVTPLGYSIRERSKEAAAKEAGLARSRRGRRSLLRRQDRYGLTAAGRLQEQIIHGTTAVRA